MPRLPFAPPDQATAYARNVLAGRIKTNRYVRLACKRHLDDIRHGAKRGLWWDLESAEHAIAFFPFLKLHEGEHDGQPFNLRPWQAFIVGLTAGWRQRDPERPNETREEWPRRFRTAYIEAAKGCGKTPLAAGMGLYAIVADGPENRPREHGAEVYTAGVTREQANYLFADCSNFVEASPVLSQRIELLAHNMLCKATGSYIRPVSSEGRSLDQKRVHKALLDEIHEHRTDAVVRKMRAGTKGRRSALIVEITNSGFDRHSICWQHHEYSIQVLEGTVQNDNWFAMVFGLDPCEKCRADGAQQPRDNCPNCDDWRDEAVWDKANPNLGVSISRKYLREQVAEAVGMPGNENIVKRLNFCLWTEQDTRALSIESWDHNTGPVAEHEVGTEAYAALDLASTTDLSSLTLVVPRLETIDDDEIELLDVVQRFWVPEEGMRARIRRDHVPYDVWQRDGLLIATPGDVTDYDYVREQVHELAETYGIRQIGYDRWNANQLVTQLASDGFEMVPIGQGMASMAAPWKETKRLIQAARYRTSSNPILRWMAGNVAEEQDAAGNAKPSKRNSTERIDGIVTLAMATGLWMAAVEPESEQSIWSTDPERSLFV